MPIDPDLQKFVETLMHHVRDRAIDTCDRLVAGKTGGRIADRWQEVLRNSDARSALTELIPDIVDEVLFELLDKADNDVLQLGWRRGNGDWVSLSDLGSGEMAGWLMGSDGWRESFSEKRFNDYLADVHLPIKDDSNGS